jgi:hypothetical protein
LSNSSTNLKINTGIATGSSKPIGESTFATAAAAARQTSTSFKNSTALKPASPRSSNAVKKSSMSPTRHTVSNTSSASPRRGGSRGGSSEKITEIELPGGVVVSATSVLEAGVALTPDQLNALLGEEKKTGDFDEKEKDKEEGVEGHEKRSRIPQPKTIKEIRASSRHVVPSHIVPSRARSKSSAASTSASEISSSENQNPTSVSRTHSSTSQSIGSRKSSTTSSPKKQSPVSSRRPSSIDEKRVSFSISENDTSLVSSSTLSSSSSPQRKSSNATNTSSITSGKSEEGSNNSPFRPDLKAATAAVGDPSRGHDRDRLRKLLSGRTLIPRPVGNGVSGMLSPVSSITEQASPTSLVLPRSPPRTNVPPRSPEPILSDIQFTDVDSALVLKLKEIQMVPYAPQFGLFGYGSIEKAKSLSIDDLNKKLSIPMSDAKRIKAMLLK